MGEHSELMSPSGAKLWIPCTAQPQAVLDAGLKEEDSDASSTGTLQHHYAELIQKEEYHLSNGKPADLNLDDWLDVEKAIESLHSTLAVTQGAKWYYELRVQFPEEWRKDCFGTADVVVIDLEAGRVHIRDYKFGRVYVDIRENEQLMIYALALMYMLEKKVPNIWNIIQFVSLGVIQPKHQRRQAVFEIGPAGLKKWETATLIPAQEKIVSGNGEFNPGSHCVDGYCKLRGRCPATVQQTVDNMQNVLAMMQNAPEKFEGVDPNSANVQFILDVGDQVKGIIDEVQAYATLCARKGEPVINYKLIEGPGGKRAWVDEAKADSYLTELGCTEDERYTKKLVGIAKAQSAAKEKAKYDKDVFEDLYKWNPGKAKLVKESIPGNIIPPDLVEEEAGTTNDVDDLLAGIEL